MIKMTMTMDKLNMTNLNTNDGDINDGEDLAKCKGRPGN